DREKFRVSLRKLRRQGSKILVNSEIRRRKPRTSYSPLSLELSTQQAVPLETPQAVQRFWCDGPLTTTSRWVISASKTLRHPGLLACNMCNPRQIWKVDSSGFLHPIDFSKAYPGGDRDIRISESFSPTNDLRVGVRTPGFNAGHPVQDFHLLCRSHKDSLSSKVLKYASDTVALKSDFSIRPYATDEVHEFGERERSSWDSVEPLIKTKLICKRMYRVQFCTHKELKDCAYLDPNVNICLFLVNYCFLFDGEQPSDEEFSDFTWHLRLLPDSKLYKTLFMSPPSPEHHNVYLFNITNPEQMLRGAKPRLKQVGPFVFRVETEISHTQFSREPRPRTLEYGFRSRFYFENRGSASSYEEKIFIPNLVHQGVVNNRFKANHPDALINLTPKEALWGYKVTAFGKWFEIGLLRSFNSSDMTNYVVDTGAEDVRRTGTVLSIDSHRQTTYYEHEEPNLVSGKVGYQTSPNAKVGDVLEITSKSLCRKIRLVANSTGPSKNHDGVKLLNFRLPSSEHMDSTTKWSERQYCLSSDECVPRGLISLGCHREEMRGIRLYVSSPFFLRGDPRVKERFEFLDPVDVAKHDTEINVEPKGLVEKKRVQTRQDCQVYSGRGLKLCSDRRINADYFNTKTEKARQNLVWTIEKSSRFLMKTVRNNAKNDTAQYQFLQTYCDRFGSSQATPFNRYWQPIGYLVDDVKRFLRIDHEKMADYDSLEAVRTSILKPFEMLQNCLKTFIGLFSVTTVVLAIALVFVLVARNHTVVSPLTIDAAKFDQDNLSQTSSPDPTADRKYSIATVSETI
ncbi:scavenger receptor class B member 1, partial [Clonorchis sinensis]